jgi:hypothetical protein
MACGSSDACWEADEFMPGGCAFADASNGIDGNVYAEILIVMFYLHRDRTFGVGKDSPHRVVTDGSRIKTCNQIVKLSETFV